MSVEKQNSNLYNLYSFYEEVTEKFLNETDVYSHFYYSIFNISESRRPIASASRGCNKMSFAIKFFQFCNLKKQQPITLQGGLTFSKRDLSSFVDSLWDFLKVFEKASNCLQIAFLKPER